MPFITAKLHDHFCLSVLLHFPSPILSETAGHANWAFVSMMPSRRLLSPLIPNSLYLAKTKMKSKFASYSALPQLLTCSTTPSLKHFLHLVSRIPYWPNFPSVSLVIPSVFHVLIPPLLPLFSSEMLECPRDPLCPLFFAFLRQPNPFPWLSASAVDCIRNV